LIAILPEYVVWPRVYTTRAEARNVGAGDVHTIVERRTGERFSDGSYATEHQAQIACEDMNRAHYAGLKTTWETYQKLIGMETQDAGK